MAETLSKEEELLKDTLSYSAKVCWTLGWPGNLFGPSSPPYNFELIYFSCAAIFLVFLGDFAYLSLTLKKDRQQEWRAPIGR